MYVQLSVVGQVVVNDERHLRDVQPPRPDVCGNEHAAAEKRGDWRWWPGRKGLRQATHPGPIRSPPRWSHCQRDALGTAPEGPGLKGRWTGFVTQVACAFCVKLQVSLTTPRGVCLKLAHTGNRQGRYFCKHSRAAASQQTHRHRANGDCPSGAARAKAQSTSAATTVAVAACSVGHTVSAAVTAVRSAGGYSGHRGRFVDGVNVSLFKI